MKKYCDLHTHSVFSDETNTPEEIIDLAIKTGLSAVALTDHNTVSGLKRFISYGKIKSIDVVPGIEITTDYKGNELHILGLFITKDMFGRISNYLKTASDLKEKSNILLVKRLNNGGYKVDYEKLKKSLPSGKINRANIAKELFEAGYVESVHAAFSTILSPEYGLYEPPERLSATETVSFLNSIGAITVWAHPLISVNYSLCEEFLSLAKKRGLKAIETIYTEYSDSDIEFAKQMCKRFNLLESGGSDFHGDVKPDILLGCGKGNISIPNEFYIELKELAQSGVIL